MKGAKINPMIYVACINHSAVKTTPILILNARLVFSEFAVFFRAEGINYMFSISNMFTAGY